MQWNGVTLPTSLKEEHVKSRIEIFQKIKEIGTNEDLWLELNLTPIHINEWQILNESELNKFWTPLHYAAQNGVSAKVIEHLVENRAWRSLKDADGNTPLDLAINANHSHLYEVLKPQFLIEFNDEYIDSVEKHFYEVINRCAGGLVESHKLRLPQLRPVLEIMKGTVTFSVPGMYGGFYYKFAVDEEAKKIKCLVVDTWCRLDEDSEERYHVTNEGYTLVS